MKTNFSKSIVGFKPFNSISDVPTNFGTGQTVLPSGKFTFVSAGVMPAIGTGSPWNGVVLETESGQQSVISARVLTGSFVEYSEQISEGQKTFEAERKEIETPFTKSKLDIITFINECIEHKTFFERNIDNDVTYSTPVYKDGEIQKLRSKTHYAFKQVETTNE